jgi:hypothetical protein
MLPAADGILKKFIDSSSLVNLKMTYMENYERDGYLQQRLHCSRLQQVSCFIARMGDTSVSTNASTDCSAVSAMVI